MTAILIRGGLGDLLTIKNTAFVAPAECYGLFLRNFYCINIYRNIMLFRAFTFAGDKCCLGLLKVVTVGIIIYAEIGGLQRACRML